MDYMHTEQIPVQASQKFDTMYHTFSTTTPSATRLCIKWCPNELMT